MLDDIFSNRGKRNVRDLNIVPILDMLVTIIFFLLLTAGFFQLTKLTVPPASVSQSSNTKPLAPKLLVGGTDHLTIQLSWSGATPGTLSKSVTAPLKDRKGAVINTVTQLISQFTAQYPSEKTLQVGLGRKTAYQDLISVMDGALKAMPDLVLISYQDADPFVGGT